MTLKVISGPSTFYTKELKEALEELSNDPRECHGYILIKILNNGALEINWDGKPLMVMGAMEYAKNHILKETADAEF